MSKIFQLPRQVVLSNQGELIPGGKAYFYEANTAIPISVYSDSDLTVAHTNPVIADGNGRFPTIYIDNQQQYKVKLTDANDVELYSQDYSSVDEVLYGTSSAENTLGVTPNVAYPVGDVRRYGAVLDKVTDDGPAIQTAINVAGYAVLGQGKVFVPGDCFINAATSGTISFPTGQSVILDFQGNEVKCNANNATQVIFDLDAIGQNQSSPKHQLINAYFQAQTFPLYRMGTLARIQDSQGQAIQDCLIHDFSTGVLLSIEDAGAVCEDTLLKNVFFETNSFAIKFTCTGGGTSLARTKFDHVTISTGIENIPYGSSVGIYVDTGCDLEGTSFDQVFIDAYGDLSTGFYCDGKMHNCHGHIRVVGSKGTASGNKGFDFGANADLGFNDLHIMVSDTVATKYTYASDVLGAPESFTDADATPSVDGGDFYATANTSATTITALDDGVAGQEVTVKIGDANTTIDFTGTTLKGNGGADWSPGSGDFMTCRFDGTNWLCQVTEI